MLSSMVVFMLGLGGIRVRQHDASIVDGLGIGFIGQTLTMNISAFYLTISDSVLSATASTIHPYGLYSQSPLTLTGAGAGKTSGGATTIAFDNAANSGVQTASSFSFNIVVGGGGTNRLLCVCAGHFKAGGTTVTGITAGGTPMTLIRRDGGDNKVELWYLVAPPTGTVSVAVTMGAATSSSVVGAISLTGVAQVSPVDAQNGTTGLGPAAATISLTTVTDNAWIVSCVKDNSNELMAAGTSQTARWNVGDASDSDTYGGSTRGPVTPPAATTMNWTGVTADWEMNVVSFKPGP